MIVIVRSSRAAAQALFDATKREIERVGVAEGIARVSPCRAPGTALPLSAQTFSAAREIGRSHFAHSASERGAP